MYLLSGLLSKFMPFNGHKMTENGSFRPLSGKVFMQSNSNLVCTLCTLTGEWSEMICFWSRWPNFGPLVATKLLKLVVSGCFLKSFHTIQFKLGAYTSWVSAHNWCTFGSRGPNFGARSSVQKKLMKLVENGCLRPPPAKLSPQSNWFLVCTLIWWAFRNDYFFAA